MNTYKFYRHFEMPFLVGTVLNNSDCIDYLAMYGLGVLIFFNAAVYERCRRFPVSVEYLPNTEMLSLTKIGLFGTTYNELWDLKDL